MLEKLHISKSEVLGVKEGTFYFSHNGVRNKCSAFYENETSHLELHIPRLLGADVVCLELKHEDGTAISKSEVPFINAKGEFDVYQASLNLPVGLYFFTVTVNTPLGLLWVKKDGFSLSFSEEYSGDFQLSVVNKENGKASLYLGGTMYHIFVDRFSKDENIEVKSGAILVDKWDRIAEFPDYPGAPMKNNTFYGGTLYSAAKRLDYLKSLGVNLVYLSPIFESPSNHKYDTADYTAVDKSFGGDEALMHFISEAKARGIGVILDGVFNHTGADSVYFNRYGTYKTLGAYQSKQSPYYGWYTFNSYPNDYVCWWGIEILPRINTGNPEFEEFILNSVIKKYRDMGILGLRLDVADELSDDFIKRIKKSLALGGENLLYGEVWEDASSKIAYGKRKTYYLGGEIDGVMNYPLREGLIEYIRKKKTDKLRFALCEVMMNAPKRVRDMQMNLLGTHDTPRILTALSGESAARKSNAELSEIKMSIEERKKGEQLLSAAYTVLATLPGIPCIFYADEVGMEGYSDPFNRMPYPKEISSELLAHYQSVGAIRTNNKVYKDGEIELITLTEELLVFARTKGREAYLTVYNNSKDTVSLTFEAPTRELLSKKLAKNHNVASECAKVFKTTADALSHLF